MKMKEFRARGRRVPGAPLDPPMPTHNFPQYSEKNHEIENILVRREVVAGPNFFFHAIFGKNLGK